MRTNFAIYAMARSIIGGHATPLLPGFAAFLSSGSSDCLIGGSAVSAGGVGAVREDTLAILSGDHDRFGVESTGTGHDVALDVDNAIRVYLTGKPTKNRSLLHEGGNGSREETFGSVAADQAEDAEKGHQVKQVSRKLKAGGLLGRGAPCTDHDECAVGKCKGHRGQGMECRVRHADCKAAEYHNSKKHWGCLGSMGCDATASTATLIGTDHSLKWGRCTASPTQEPTLTPTEAPTLAPTPAPTGAPIPLGHPSCMAARISGKLYKEASGASSVTSMAGNINLIGSGHAFTEVGQLGYFSMPRGENYFAMPDVAKRDTWTMYFLFNIGINGHFTFAGADPGGYGNLDSQIGFGPSNNNFIKAGMETGEMFFSTHGGTIYDGVHSDGMTLNDNDWHWVEFESSNLVASYKMTFNTGATFEHTVVNLGFGRDDEPFRVFCGQGCNQDGTLKISEAIVYNKMLTDAEKAYNRAYLDEALAVLKSNGAHSFTRELNSGC